MAKIIFSNLFSLIFPICLVLSGCQSALPDDFPWGFETYEQQRERMERLRKKREAANKAEQREEWAAMQPLSNVDEFDLAWLATAGLRELCFKYYTYRRGNYIGKIYKDFPEEHYFYSIRSYPGYRARSDEWHVASLKAMLQLERALRRKGITQKEMDLIKAGKISIGMNLNAMYGAWGRPIRENRTVSQYSTRIQHVYPGSVFIYTTDGAITSWQD